MGEQEVAELAAFLRPESRPDVRRQAVRAALGLTGDAAGRRLLAGQPALAAALLALAGDPCAAVADEACRALVNLAGEPAARGALEPGLPALLRRALDAADPRAALAGAALANLSREEASCRALLRAVGRELGGPAALLEACCAAAAPPHLGPLLANLSQLPEGRAFLLDPSRQVRGGVGGVQGPSARKEAPRPLTPAVLPAAPPPRCVLQRLLPHTQDAASSLRRSAVVGTLRNCCFDYGHHEWLLDDQVDVLPFLLLPLAGPEEFPEDEMEKLPVDLQYLPPEKQREPDPDIRKMLLEAVLLLTATKPGRQLVRERGTYFILRELHKWEKDPGVLVACEKLIQVLIGDEPEPGMENLLEVEIPAEVEEQLQRLDREEEQRERPTPGSQAPRG